MKVETGGLGLETSLPERVEGASIFPSVPWNCDCMKWHLFAKNKRLHVRLS